MNNSTVTYAGDGAVLDLAAEMRELMAELPGGVRPQAVVTMPTEYKALKAAIPPDTHTELTGLPPMQFSGVPVYVEMDVAGVIDRCLELRRMGMEISLRIDDDAVYEVASMAIMADIRERSRFVEPTGYPKSHDEQMIETMRFRGWRFDLNFDGCNQIGCVVTAPDGEKTRLTCADFPSGVPEAVWRLEYDYLLRRQREYRADVARWRVQFADWARPSMFRRTPLVATA